MSSLHLLRSPPSFSAKLSNFVFSVPLFLRSRHLLLLLRLLSFFLCSSPFFVRYIPSPVLTRFRRFCQILCADSALSLPISSIVLIFLIFFLLAFSLPQIFSFFFACFLLFYSTISCPCCLPPPPPSHLLISCCCCLLFLFFCPFFSFLELSFGCRLPFTCSADFFFLRQLFASRTVLFLSVFQLLFSCSLCFLLSGDCRFVISCCCCCFFFLLRSCFRVRFP